MAAANSPCRSEPSEVTAILSPGPCVTHFMTTSIPSADKQAVLYAALAQPDFAPTRAAGLERLRAFLPHTGSHYARTRNSDFGPDERTNVSALSPFVRHRLVLETEIVAAVLERFAPSTAEKFVQEVFWRTYFKGYLEQRPSIWTDYRAQVDRLVAALKADRDLAQRYRRAVEGRTGIDCFDAWAHELVETGYLHNHTRMWFASIWIFTLHLPWQLGADFFYRHLMDADPASNTLSWRWVGGLHTKGKTYLARPGNIKKYTDGRFAPIGELAGTAPPLEEDAAHDQRPIPAVGPLPGGAYVLAITEEDCAPELLELPHAPSGLVGLIATDARSPLPLGETAAAFAHGAVGDAMARAQQTFGLEAHALTASSDDWAAPLRAAAKSTGVSDIVTAYAPVGPVAEALAKARVELAGDGITLHQLRRPIDDLAWPFATRGYFGLRKKIPDILEGLGATPQPRLL